MSTDLLVPETVVGARFRVEQLLGEGGLGALYRALDQQTQQPVALRLIAAEVAKSNRLIEQLRSQINLACTLVHKNVARVIGIGKEGGLHFVVGEHVEGISVRELVARQRLSGRTLGLKTTYNIVAHACSALQAAHDLGGASLIHGLPGPGALLVAPTGRVKLADLGMVPIWAAAGARAFDRLGDCLFAAPELLRDPRHAGAAADIHVIGLLLRELLAIDPLSDVPAAERSAGLPEGIGAIVARCTAADPRARYATLEAVKSDLYAALQRAELSGQHALTPAPATISAAAGVTFTTPSAARSNTATAGPFTAHAPSPSRSPAAGPAAPAAARAIVRRHSAPQARAPVVEERPLEELLADAAGADPVERWVVHRNRLDFGPFTAADLRQRLYRGEFSADDLAIDQETGTRGPLRRQPAFEQFIRVLDRHQHEETAQRTLAETHQRDKRRHATVIVVVALSLVLTAVIGGVIYLRLRHPVTKERIVKVYRDREQRSGPNIDSIKFSWSAEPANQAARRRLLRVRPRRAADAPSAAKDPEHEVTYLGDASKSGGDQLLSQQQIQSAIRQHQQQLVPCIIAQARSDPRLRQVAIAFGVRGSGEVSYVKVNEQSSGVFHDCIAQQLGRVRFPPYDGGVTHASFKMSLEY
ncbi:MAG: AgmX/PglI C-terminal domain-containing protein [Proteobacteria bacterium]|nr:AgmX/PglI C-terminal domain-containing protein [Pseudomonadota bacterium]